MNDRNCNRLYHCFAIALIIAVCLLAGRPVSAQDLNFRHLSIDDGLSQNAVYSILQHSRGFVWYGISVQFVRGMSAKTYNPDEERGAGNRLGLSFTDGITKAHRAKSLKKPKNNKRHHISH